MGADELGKGTVLAGEGILGHGRTDGEGKSNSKEFKVPPGTHSALTTVFEMDTVADAFLEGKLGPEGKVAWRPAAERPLRVCRERFVELVSMAAQGEPSSRLSASAVE